MIPGVTLTPLMHLSSQGGDVYHAMKEHDQGYTGFGEAYFSWIESGKIKAWKRHSQMTLNLIIPLGNVRFIFPLQQQSGHIVFEEINVGEGNYQRVTISPGTWFGFQGISESRSLLLNIASIKHNPHEVENAILEKFNFNWDQR